MRVQNVSDPVYAPNSKGGPKADPTRYPQVEVWEASGEFVHAAYTMRKDHDDFGQGGTLVRKVMDDAQRDRLVRRCRPPPGRADRAGTRARDRVIGGTSTKPSATISPRASGETGLPRNS